MLSKGRIRSSKAPVPTDANAPASSAAAMPAATSAPATLEDSESYKPMLNIKKRLDKMLKTIEDELDTVDKYA